jgi:hypothetical protein
MSKHSAVDPKDAIVYHACRCEQNLKLADFACTENAFHSAEAFFWARQVQPS